MSSCNAFGKFIITCGATAEGTRGANLDTGEPILIRAAGDVSMRLGVKTAATKSAVLDLKKLSQKLLSRCLQASMLCKKLVHVHEISWGRETPFGMCDRVGFRKPQQRPQQQQEPPPQQQQNNNFRPEALSRHRLRCLDSLESTKLWIGTCYM